MSYIKQTWLQNLRQSYVLFFLLASQFLFPQEYQFTVYNDGLNSYHSDDNYKVFQDSDGFIWALSYGRGLFRYDGRNFTSFNEKNGIKNTQLLNIIEDKDNHLWVLSDAGLYRSRSAIGNISQADTLAFVQKFANTTLTNESISQVAPNSISLGANNTVWVSTNEGNVYEYQYNDKGIQLKSSHPFSGENLLAIFSDSKGTIWLSTSKGIYQKSLDSETFTQINSSETSVITFYECNSRRIYFGYANGRVNKLVENDFSNLLEILPPRGASTYHISAFHNNGIIVNTHGEGVFVFSATDSLKYHFSTRNGLLEDAARSSLLDREGNIWISLSGGLAKLKYNFENFTYLTGETSSYSLPNLRDASLNGISRSKHDGNLWLASHKGLAVFNKDYKAQYIDVNDGLANNVTYDVLVDRENRIWTGNFNGTNIIYPKNRRPTNLGSSKSSTLHIFGEKHTVRFFETGIAGAITSFDVNGNELIGIVSYNQVALYFQNQWYILSQESGIPLGIVYSLSLDENNYLYISSGTKGIFKSRKPLSSSYLSSLNTSKNRRVLEPVFEHTPALNSIPYLEIIAFESKLFLGSAQSIDIVEQSDFSTVKTLKESGIYTASYNEAHNTLWFNTNDGVLELNTKSLELERKLTMANGLLSKTIGWLEAIVLDDDGLLYIGSRKGLNIYNTNVLSEQALEVKSAIESIHVQCDNFGDNDVQIAFSSPNFVSEHENQFSFRLEGFDSDWTTPQSDNSVRYTNLSAYLWDQEYSFELRSSNSDGVWSKPVRATFLISPAFWLRWWFLPFYLAFFFYLNKSLFWLAKNWRFLVSPRTKFIGKYKILSTLGTGSMSRVYDAFDPDKKKAVALKVIESGETSADDLFRMFIKEAEIGQQLRHPHIVSVFAAGSSEQFRFLSMEKVEGKNLRLLLRDGSISPEDFSFILNAILDGVAYLHENNIVHRDLKSTNILVNLDKRELKISDFGLATSKNLISLNERSNLVGTLAYMSPEQSVGRQVDYRTDIYALGVVFYELIFGELPYKTKNEMELIFAIHNETPEQFIVSKHPMLPLIKRCMERNPLDRFEHIRDIQAELKKVTF